MLERDWHLEEDGSDLTGMEALFRREHQNVFRLCLAILGNRADAEEAVQDAFLRVAPRFGHLQGNAGAYLMVVARRVCWEMRRSRRAETLPLEAAPGAGDDPEAETIARRRVQQTLSGLSSTDRRLILDSYAGYSYAETAVRTGLSANAVAVALSRARARARGLAGDFASTLLPPLAGLRARLWVLLRREDRVGDADRYAALQTIALRWLAGGLVVAGLAASGATSTEGGPPRHHRPAPSPVMADPGTPSQAAIHAVAVRIAAPEGGGARQASPAPPAWHPTWLVGGTLQPGGGGVPPEDAAIDGFAVSPGYRSDRTTFALGTLGQCAAGCQLLFISHDGGGSWTNLDSSGLPDSTVRILLPPGYPDDPTVFAMSNSGLSISADRGRSFSPAEPVPGYPAIDPASRPRAARVVIGAAAMLGYDQASGRTSPEPMVYSSENGADSLLFLPDGAGLLEASEFPSQSQAGWSDDQISVCQTLGACRAVFTVTTPAGSPIALLGSGGAGGVVFALSGAGGLWRAPLATLQFSQLTPPGPPSGLAVGSDGTHLAAAMPDLLHPSDAALALSSDGGRTWSAPFDPPSLRGAGPLLNVTYLPDGRLLGSVTVGPGGGWGLVCSGDGGLHWSPRC